MKIEIKNILNNCWLKIKNEQVINKIIWALKGRFEKYHDIWISRKEFLKFWVTERQMYLIIEELKDLWLIKLNWYKRIINNKYKICIYEISSVLKQIFWLLSYFIKDFNKKIIEFNKWDIENILNKFWIKTFNNWKLFDRKSKITFSKRKWVITNWKELKHYNLFNFLKETFWLSSINLYRKII
jgi:hypothetical protein